MRRATEAIAHGIGVVGLLNVQYALKDDVLYVLEANPNPQIADNFPSENPILVTIIWIVVFIAVFGPLGVRRYRNMSR